MKILLQVCCAPCFLGCADRIIESGDVTLFYFNPNIDSVDEFQKRLDNLKTVMNEKYENLSLVVEEYDGESFLNNVVGLEGEPEGGRRCERCIFERLEGTARKARQLGFDAFDSTLSVSPHKNYEIISRFGEELEKKYGVKYLGFNFKKQDGFLKSSKLSKEMGIYRQSYCGCEFSKDKK